MNEEMPAPEPRPWILAWFPKLSREERQELSTRIRSGATGGADFYVMMLLASGVSSKWV